MKQLRVHVPTALADQLPVLATLPSRFAVTDDQPDVVAVDGANAVTGTPVAVMLVRPGLVSATAFDGLDPVGLALHAAPALTDEAVALLQLPGDDRTLIVDAAAETPGPLRAALFELLMLLDRLGCHADTLTILATTPTQVTLSVASTGSWQGVRVTAARSFRTRFMVETVSQANRRSIAIAGTAVATAADVKLHDASGTRTALPRFEGGLRASWQALYARLTEGGPDQTSTARHLLSLLDAAGVA